MMEGTEEKGRLLEIFSALGCYSENIKPEIISLPSSDVFFVKRVSEFYTKANTTFYVHVSMSSDGFFFVS